MQDNTVYSILFFAACLYLFKMWVDDAKHFKKNGSQRKGSFAGASFAPKAALCLAATGAIALLFAQTLLESKLGFADQQNKVGAFAIFSWVSAAFIEELVFRGYLVVQNKGKLALCASIFAFSFLFALMHPFLWDYSIPENAQAISLANFSLNFTGKALFSTSFIFINSLFFYFMRFNKLNKSHSLLPSIVAHLSYNIGVFIIKLLCGYVEF